MRHRALHAGAVSLALGVLAAVCAGCGGPDQYQERYDAGVQYLNRGEHRNAVAELEQAVEANSDSVEARLKLVMRDDVELSFRVASVADARGRYRLRLPYSNEGAASSLRVGRRYRLESGGQTALLEVAESLVQSGAELAGPDFSGR